MKPPASADDPLVKVFPRRRVPDPAQPPRDGGFGAWLLRQFTAGQPTEALPYAEIERLCANAGSLLCGAAFARPHEFAPAVELPRGLAGEAAVLSRRTADGFKASLADRKNTVIAWPWDHMATQIAWEATRAGDTSADALGEALLALGGAYATRHREQLAAVLDLWAQVAASLREPTTPGRPDLARMGGEMLTAYEAVSRELPAAPS